MEFKRSSGVILHPTSLPGPFGIGDFGPTAIHWLDFMAKAELGLWEILPLGPTGYGDSPYQCFSAFAGNTRLISPILLVEDGLISIENIENHPHFSNKKVDFNRITRWKDKILLLAFKNYYKSPPASLKIEFESFRQQQSDWMDDYALFMSIKDIYKKVAWNQWPDELRFRDQASLDKFKKKNAKKILLHAFKQYLFFKQWETLHDYAQSKNVLIVGDLPLFIAFDSADVWTNPELFDLTETHEPRVIAGVPPDYFSPTGQLWGNPHYRWSAHKQTGYQWWLRRFQKSLEMMDIVRLDHFRGFSGYWEVKAGMPTAEEGRWVQGPGSSFFEEIEKKLGKLPIIAEDLGVITPDVTKMRDRFNFPSMRVLQFAFSSDANNPFLPHNYPDNCVAFTGTHDNTPSRSWYQNASTKEREFCRQYLKSNAKHIAWDMIRAIWASAAIFTFAPMQDFLELGNKARMNFPGVLGNNWNWRIHPNAMRDSLALKIKEINTLFSRSNNPCLETPPSSIIEYEEP
jgi:4-alpha-glucanotransferase